MLQKVISDKTKFAVVTQALTAMLEESATGSNLSRKATLLMAEVLQMANRVLPLSLAAKIQAGLWLI